VHEFTIEYLKYGLTYAITVKVVDSDGNKSLGSLIIVTMPRVVDDLNLAPYITAPMQNILPDTRRITGTQYTGTVTWSVMTGNITGNIDGNDGKFSIGKKYVAMVALTPNPGYTFANLPNDSFIYGGATVFTNAVSGGISITFPALGKAWFVADFGKDNDEAYDGSTRLKAFNSVNKALEKIAEDHEADHPDWTNADIVVIGTSGDTRTILIDNNNANIYPPITLRGLSPAQQGILTADKGGWTNPTGATTNPLVADAYRVLEITKGAKVTLGNDLTITGGGQRADVEYGAGVFVHNDASFTMNGGTITGNKAYITAVGGSGGGVFVRYDSTFTMNGGTISHNYSYRTGGVAVYDNSTFTMTGGAITNNDIGGVRIMTASTFTMSGGIISANTSTSSGGGVLLSYVNTIFTMTGGAITGHIAQTSGGGVTIHEGAAFTMTGGTISDNTAKTEYGGGVNLGTTAMSFTMNGGTISGNTAASGGGGVAVQSGTFIKEPAAGKVTSGIIYGNDGGVNSNTATSADALQMNLGHAVYMTNGPKTRETTITAYESLDSAADDGWTE
jgi:hypothetical protein